MELNKRIASILRISVCVTGVVCVTGCVSPFYGTARIEKGLNVDIGVTGMTYIGAYGEWMAPSVGVMGNLSVRYGFNPYLQFGARFGAGYGQTGFLAVDDSGNFHNPWEFGADAAINVQTSLPRKNVTPGLILEYSSVHGFSAALLAGWGKPERFTLGLRGSFWGSYAPAGFDLLAIVRPLPRLSLFIGLDPLATFLSGDGFWPVSTLGLGYTFGRLGEKNDALKMD
jgi:hypothetical protein